MSLMTIALVGALIGGGVYAYFSDVETSTGNAFAAGTLNLQVGAADPTTETISILNLKPGDTGNAATWTVTNAGSISGNLSIAMSAITNNENTLTEPESEAGDVTGGAGEGELGQFLKVAIWADIDENGWDLGDVALESDGGKLTNSGADPLPYDYLDQYDSDSFTDVQTMAAASHFAFMVDYDFPSDANDNRAQSDNATFNITFTLNQTLP